MKLAWYRYVTNRCLLWKHIRQKATDSHNFN